MKLKKTGKLNKVLVGGCFDILHFGHVHFLKKSKFLGDYLIVALESDENVRRLKGKGRPIHTQKQRKEILESLRFVDEVIVLPNKMVDKDYFDFVKKISPNTIAITSGDPIKNIKGKQAEWVNAKLVEIPRVKVASTTKISKLLKLD